MSIDQTQVVGTDTQISVIEVGIPGPMGDVTPEMVAERKAAEKAAREAEASAEEARQYAEESEAAAQLAQDFISSVKVIDAEVYDPEKQYVFPNLVISPIDGGVYRCIKPSIGEEPSQSIKWVEVAMVISETFEFDENGDLMPRLNPRASHKWTFDPSGNIMPAE